MTRMERSQGLVSRARGRPGAVEAGGVGMRAAQHVGALVGRGGGGGVSDSIVALRNVLTRRVLPKTEL